MWIPPGGIPSSQVASTVTRTPPRSAGYLPRKLSMVELWVTADGAARYVRETQPAHRGTSLNAPTATLAVLDRLEIWLMLIDARSGRLEKRNGRPRGGHNNVHNQREKIE